MLKRVPVTQLRRGMFVHALCGSWMDHPFWRSAFKLKDPKDIRRVIESGVREAWIDTSKWLDRPGCPDRIIDHEDPAKWGFGDLSEMWAMPA